MPKFIDLEGKRFGKIYVIALSHRDRRGQIHWKCKCDCGLELIKQGYGLTGRGQNACRSCTHSKDKKKTFYEKFKLKNDCWEWTGFVSPEGYGTFRSKGAHRYSWILHKGDIPKDMFVCHSCDNKKCVNPHHLYLGTPKDNTRDALLRGLHPTGPNKKKGSPGEKNCKAKLNREKVEYVKQFFENGYKKSSIAKIFDVHETTISKIIKGKTWAS